MRSGFGAFGKMPALGDFFQLNAPEGFVRVWDTWLQGAMMASAEASGDDWDTFYMSAPIWRFTLAAGLAGPSKVMGILMPSVDRVGRRFPLALMARVDREGPATLDHLNQNATYMKLEDIALAALDDGMDRDRLGGLLAEIAPPLPHSYAPLRKAGNTLVLTQANPESIAPELAAGLVGAQNLNQPSLWTALLDGNSRAMLCDGMPDAHQARALFDLNAPLWADARPAI